MKRTEEKKVLKAEVIRLRGDAAKSRPQTPTPEDPPSPPAEVAHDASSPQAPASEGTAAAPAVAVSPSGGGADKPARKLGPRPPEGPPPSTRASQ